jgi:hypothetical protein
MALLRNLSIAIASFVFVAGCSGSGDGSEPTQTIHGKLAAGASSAKSYGGISLANGASSLRVTAREVHKRGAIGRKADVAVDGNGEFRIDVARGSRYIVMVQSGDKGAMVTLGDGNNVLSVSANGAGSTVELGQLQIVGGEARTSVSIDGALGVSFGAAEPDDVFEDVNGALRKAQEAIAEAEKAAQQAIREAEAAVTDAKKAADEARKADETAAQSAGH